MNSIDRFARRTLHVFLMASVALAFASAPIHAQEMDAGEEVGFVEEVLVTGSRIASTSDEISVTPVSVFGAEDIDASGVATLEGFIQAQPFVTGGFLSSRVNNGNRGYATIALRGLGSGRTLVLVDGHRLPPFNTGSSVDVNLIPMGMVERMEVLRDGASTIYGSDAIAGVVNIITKKDFDGIDLRFQSDVTDEGDGEIYRASMTVGSSTDRASVVLGAEYTERRAIWQGDREFSRCPLQEVGGELVCSGSGTSYPAHIYPTQSSGDWIVDPDTGELRPFQASDGYNYALASYMVTPNKVYSAFADGRFDLLEDGKLTAFTNVLYANRTSQQQMAAVGTFWGPTVSAEHPDNPFDEDVWVYRRLAENTTGRYYTEDAWTFRMIGGLEGEFENGWDWTVNYNYARYQDAQIMDGFINVPRVDTALSPSACAADPDCPHIWNPFARDTLDEALKDYVLVTYSPVGRREQRVAQAILTGDMGGFQLEAGPIGWAIGAEQRKEDGSFVPDGAAKLDMIYFVAGDQTVGEIQVDEYYAEINVPLISGRSFADLLAVTASVRRSDYGGTIGADTNAKYSVEWAPIPSLRFRGTYAEGFRAPSIGDLYFPETKSAQQYNDPCLNYGAGASANVTANCQADGLPPDFYLTSTQGTALFGGNAELMPEQSESTSFGVVWTPTFADLSVRLDYFDIEITDGIGTAGTNNVITSCYESLNFSHPLCALIEGPGRVDEAPHHTSPYRNGLGNIAGIILTNANLATFNTSGIDFAVDYSMDVGDGRLDLGVSGTWLDENSYVAFAGADRIEQVGFFAEDQWTGNPAAFAEWQARFKVGYTADTWGVNLFPRYISSTDDIFASPANLVNKAPSIWYYDAQAWYNWGNWDLTLGVRNLTDEDPPYVTNNDDMNTIMQTYDTAGRYFYLRMAYRM